MALYFHPLYENYILGPIPFRILGIGLQSTSPFLPVSPSMLRAFTIFGGVQPSATDFETNFNTTYRNNHLVHFAESTWSSLSTNAQTSDITQYSILVLPSPTSASASGTATWAVLWYRETTYTALSSAIGASFYAGTDSNWGRYVILPVSNNSGNGMIKLTSTTIVSGNLVDVQSGGFNITVSPIV